LFVLPMYIETFYFLFNVNITYASFYLFLIQHPDYSSKNI
jgi:hypothetical protein